MAGQGPRRDRGAAAVEFALLLPVLFLIIGATIDFGRFFYTQNITVNAAREGARMLALGYPVGNAATNPSAARRVSQAMIATPTYTATYRFIPASGSPVVNGACPTSSAQPGDHVDVKVTVDTFTFMVLGPAFKIMGGTVTQPLAQRYRRREVWRMTRSSRRRAEHGGVMTIVGIMLATGVFLGMASISLDVGRILVEKRELQNSADAAAVSLARDCWITPGSCTATQATAVGLTNRNASDGTSTIQSVCSVNIPGSAAGACGAPIRRARRLRAAAAGASPACPACPTSRSAPGPAPRVGPTPSRTGSPARPSAATRRAVPAPARAPPSGPPPRAPPPCPSRSRPATGRRATGGTTGGGGGLYYASPVYNGTNPYGYTGAGQPGWPLPAVPAPGFLPGNEVILLSQNPPGGATPAGSCPNWQGHALPGGFGVLETDGDPCAIKEYSYHWMHTQTGNNISCDLSVYVGKVVNLPIFDCTHTSAPGSEPPVGNCDAGNGNNAYYHRVGYAQFYLSGYSMNVTGSIPNKVKSLVSNSFPCNGPDRCISGWFLKGSLSATALSGPPTTGNFGTVAAVPAG